MTAHSRLPEPLVESIRKALTRNALPGETHGLSREAELEAAQFLADVAAQRKKGEVGIEIESTGGEAGHRRMRIGIVNDDMVHPNVLRNCGIDPERYTGFAFGMERT